jgi:hypothetical protein
MAQGLAREDVIRAARRQFGNTTLLKEDRRSLQTLPSIEILWRDLRYAVRTLSRSPGFAAAAVLALALGIASNTAIFSVVHATFLAPLPYQDSDQLVFVWAKNRGGRSATTAADLFEWRRRSGAFSELHVTGMRMVNLAGGDRPEQLTAQFATRWGGFRVRRTAAGGARSVTRVPIHWREGTPKRASSPVRA